MIHSQPKFLLPPKRLPAFQDRGARATAGLYLAPYPRHLLDFCVEARVAKWLTLIERKTYIVQRDLIELRAE